MWHENGEAVWLGARGPDRSIRVTLYICDGGSSFELPVDTQCRVLRKTTYCGGHLNDDEDHIYMGLTSPWYKLECAGISGWLPVSQTR